MRIREYMPDDLDALRRMHAAQGFGYPFPDLENPLFLVKLVLEEDGDDVVDNFGQAACVAAERARHAVPLHEKFADAANNSSSESVAAVARLFRGGELPDGNSPGSEDPGYGKPVRPLTGAHESRIASHESRPCMAVLLRLTAEAYLLHDPATGTPRSRWRNLLALHEAARCAAVARGLDDVQAFLPPRVARAFGRRLERLGWRRDPWRCFSRRVL